MSEIFFSCYDVLRDSTRGSMPELEHLKLRFCLHKVECLNGASDFGIQRLSTLNVVEVYIYGCLADRKEYNPEADIKDSNVRCVISSIKAAVGAFPNRPACRFQLARNYRRLGSFHGLTETLNQYNGVSFETLVQKMLKSRGKQLVRNNSLLRFQ